MKGLIHTIRARLARAFPDRQIYFRTNGKVHFVHLSPRVQKIAAGAGLIAGIWVLAASAAFLWQPVNDLAHQARLQEKQRALDEMAAANARMAERIRAMQQDFSRQTQELELRQKYLNAIFEKQGVRTPAALPAPALPAKPKAGSGGQAAAAPRPATPVPAAKGFITARLAEVRAAQDRLIAALTRKTENDIDRVSDLVDSTGLSSARFLRVMAQTSPAAGQGGPMIPLNSETARYDAAVLNAMRKNGGDDEDFMQLLSKYRQLAGLQAFLATAPVRSPVADAYVTSPFGARADPIEGNAAFHPGVDLQSKASQTITAAAPGTVTFAGQDGEYGNSVIINHRNGFQTRYAHMSRVSVRIGDKVAQGDAIGRIGSTGRSTGLHLHYEIWFNGKLQNPAKFLKAADHVFDLRQAATNGQVFGG